MSPQANHRSSTTVIQLTPSGVSTEMLRRWTLSARRRLRLTGDITITIVPPKISRQWNERYRQRPRPTNVLSFDYAHDAPSGERYTDGDILLCPFVIRREAKTLGESYRKRLRMLLEHGLIHLLGLDHQTDAEQRHWETLEQRLI